MLASALAEAVGSRDGSPWTYRNAPAPLHSLPSPRQRLQIHKQGLDEFIAGEGPEVVNFFTYADKAQGQT